MVASGSLRSVWACAERSRSSGMSERARSIRASALRVSAGRAATFMAIPCHVEQPPSSFGARLLDELPDPRRRQRQHARLDAERIGDRIGDHAADRDDAALAGALGAERIVRRGLLLQGMRAD